MFNQIPYAELCDVKRSVDDELLRRSIVVAMKIAILKLRLRGVLPLGSKQRCDTR